ncbi:MAG: hypothetical protein EOO38_26740, partial [Cytophagaceae bacterium]
MVLGHCLRALHLLQLPVQGRRCLLRRLHANRNPIHAARPSRPSALRLQQRLRRSHFHRLQGIQPRCSLPGRLGHAHLELTREIVRRFNFLYGAKLPEPRPIFTETPTLLGTDGRKMSKSYGNTFFLLQEEDELAKTLRATPTDPARVKRTDPGEPTKCPIYAFHKLFSPPSDLPWVENGCRTAAIGCGDCKKKLGENINGLMAKPREKKKELLRSPDTLDSIIADGCQRARLKARETLDHVK